MKLRNMMEEMADFFLDDVWANEEMCKCAKCRMDVLARALNNLTPRYLVTETGRAFTRAEFLDAQNNVNVLTALSAAVRVVKKKPRHL